MTTSPDFATAFARCPLVAILRGVHPEEVVQVGTVLVEAGFTLIEVPLNSPEPIRSIGLLAEAVGDRAMVGAGTVLNVEEVEAVAGAGGRIIVSPNVKTEVIRATRAQGLTSLPGYFTPSEAFAALAAGADALKLFPAEAASPSVLKAQSAVLPKGTRKLVVGGISPDNMQPWRDAGADGFGIGSALYKSGKTIEAIRDDAKRFIG